MKHWSERSLDVGRAGQVARDATPNTNTLQLGSAVTANAQSPAWIDSTTPF
jgi:hypothetical protein